METNIEVLTAKSNIFHFNLGNNHKYKYVYVYSMCVCSFHHMSQKNKLTDSFLSSKPVLENNV